MRSHCMAWYGIPPGGMLSCPTGQRVFEGRDYSPCFGEGVPLSSVAAQGWEEWDALLYVLLLSA
jgi:hypothetical protein